MSKKHSNIFFGSIHFEIVHHHNLTALCCCFFFEVVWFVFFLIAMFASWVIRWCVFGRPCLLQTATVFVDLMYNRSRWWNISTSALGSDTVRRPLHILSAGQGICYYYVIFILIILLGFNHF